MYMVSIILSSLSFSFFRLKYEYEQRRSLDSQAFSFSDPFYLYKILSLTLPLTLHHTLPPCYGHFVWRPSTWLGQHGESGSGHPLHEVDR